MRDDQRGTGLLLQDHDRAQRDRNVKGRLDQLLDRAFTQVKPTTEVTHHRRQTRANDVRADLGGDRGTIEQTALRTGASVGLVLGDDGRQHGKLGDLMPGRFGIVGARFCRQRCLAAGASLGDIRDDDIDPRCRQPESVVSLMAGLPTATSSGARLDDRLGSVQGVGRRRR